MSFKVVPSSYGKTKAITSYFPLQKNFKISVKSRDTKFNKQFFVYPA